MTRRGFQAGRGVAEVVRIGVVIATQGQKRTLGSFVLSGIYVSGINVEESSLYGRHIVVSCTLSYNEMSINTHVLIDTGASGYAFMDKDFVSTLNIPTLELKKPRTIKVINSRTISSG